MSTIGELWFVWLTIGAVCYGYVLLNQLNRIERLFSRQEEDRWFFTQGLRSFALAGLAGTVSWLLFAVAIIINFTD